MATSCFKKQGAQIDTFKLSSCPKKDFTLPNFAETEDLILTQSSSENFKCRNFKSYAKMTKEGIGIEAIEWNFLIKISEEKIGCNVQIMIPRYCSQNRPCSTIAENIHRYVPDLEKTLAQLFFRDNSISIVSKSAAVFIEEDEFKKLCD